VAEAAIPLFVIGLYAVQLPRIRRLGLAGAVGYAYAFIFFTGTVSFAPADHTRDWNALVHRMGPWIAIHGVVMVLAGLAFGLAVIRAGVLPRWTGVTLMVGVVLVAASSRPPRRHRRCQQRFATSRSPAWGHPSCSPDAGSCDPPRPRICRGRPALYTECRNRPRDFRTSPRSETRDLAGVAGR
jgi:hypothetical protein